MSEKEKKYQISCIGRIKGKVLKVEPTTDKFSKTPDPYMKIRINKTVKEVGKGFLAQKPYLVYYGLQNP